MLIYLNAASLRWPTINSRFPDASSLRSDNDPMMAAVLARSAG